MAEKKKRKSEERSPHKVPPKKSEAAMPKESKDKDKAPRGNVSFAIFGKGPQKSISAAPTRAERFQHEGGYCRDLSKSKQEIGSAVLLHTSVRALNVQSMLRCGTKYANSVAAARNYFEKRYPWSSPRQVAEGILKGLSVYTGCTAAPH